MSQNNDKLKFIGYYLIIKGRNHLTNFMMILAMGTDDREMAELFQ